METQHLPFPRSNFDRGDPGGNTLTLDQLPDALRAVAEAKPFVMEYLRGLPIEQIGIPTYYPKLSRKLRSLRHRNLIYPTGDENVFVHIYPDPVGARDIYIPIEPVVTVSLNGLVEQVETRLMDRAEVIGQAVEAKRSEAFTDALDKICMVSAVHKPANGRVYCSARELDALKYLFVRDKLGLGPLQPLLADPYIEDISCSGLGSMFIEHKIFKSLTSSIYFKTHDDLDDFVVQMGERIKRPVTLRSPIVDATLPDGSRVNIVYGRDIAKRGSNFTIRKFSDDTLHVLNLIEFGTMDYMMAAYLWLAIEEGANVFVVGPTASGKTTLLNALTAFMKPDAKIVTIEDTPELQVPHKNWVREVVRDMSKNGGEGVDMFALLKAALRQRPDRIMIGEIRGAEGNIAFQAMQTGHGVMATFHASSVQKTIQRLTGDPINVPKVNIDNLDLIVIQAAVRGPDGQTVRRITSINELVDYNSVDNSFSFVTAFRWKSEDDTFEFPGDMNSFLLEQKIAPKRGLPESKARQIYGDVRKRAAILEKLQKRAGTLTYDRFFEIISEAYKQGLI